MYVVIVYSKTHEPLSDLMPVIGPKFPDDRFYIFEGGGRFQLRLEGTGDERAPRTFAKTFLKSWQPKMEAMEPPFDKGMLAQRGEAL